MTALRATPGVKRVETWAQDEARFGLQPTARRVWSRRGARPVAWQQPRYEWRWVYGCVHPPTGRTHWLEMPCVNTAAMSAALATFARDVGADAAHRVVLVLDRAGWHRSKKLVVPQGVELWWLPAYTPQLNPAERLWTLVREAVANRVCASLDELDAVVGARCVALYHAPRQICRTTNYHWWPWC